MKKTLNFLRDKEEHKWFLPTVPMKTDKDNHLFSCFCTSISVYRHKYLFHFKNIYYLIISQHFLLCTFYCQAIFNRIIFLTEGTPIHIVILIHILKDNHSLQTRVLRHTKVLQMKNCLNYYFYLYVLFTRLCAIILASRRKESIEIMFHISSILYFIKV